MAGCGIRTVFSPIQEFAKADMLLSDYQISLVQGMAVSVPIMLLSIPIGRLTDRGNRVRLLAMLIFVAALGAAWTAFATSAGPLFAARMLAGIGGVCTLPVAMSLLADYSSARRRGRSMILLQFGQMAGNAGAFALGAVVMGGSIMTLDVEMPKWRQLQLVCAAIGVCAGLSVLLLREPARREMARGICLPLSDALAILWARRRLLGPLIFGQISVVMADSAAIIWSASVLTRNHQLAPEQFGGWMAVVILVSGGMGGLLGGLAVDYGQRPGARGGIMGGAVLASILAIPAAFYAIHPSVTGFALLLALLLGCGSATGIITVTVLALKLPNEVRGLCLSVFIALAALAGLGIAPTLVPLLASLLGGEARTGLALGLMTGFTSLIAVAGFVAAGQAMAKSS